MNTEKFECRTKTQKLIAALDVPSREAVNTYIQSVMGLEPKTAFGEVVKMKLSPESVLDQNPYFWDTMVDGDVISKICGDITANYKKTHPKCWLHASTKEFPQALRKDLGNDVTLLFIIKKRLSYRVKTPMNLSKVEILLTSDDEKKRYGGLMELGFTKKEAGKFKTFTDSIWEYLKESFLPNEQDTDLKEEKVEAPEQASVDKPKEEKKKDPLTADELMKNIELIKELFKAAHEAVKASSALGEIWVEVEKLGLDPDELLSKRLTFLDLFEKMGAI